MKRTSYPRFLARAAMTLLAVFCFLGARAQVQIGSGEATNSNLPSNSYYNYSVSQQIYTADEIDASGNITSIAFYNGGTAKARKFNIYLAHTDKTAFDDNSDWIELSDADLVYEGTEAVTMTAGAWTTFTLDTPFAYNGTDNLVVGVLDLTGSWESGLSCRVFDATGNQAIYKYQDSGAYGIDGTYDGSVVAGTLLAQKSQIILGGIQQAYPAPMDLACTGVTANSATLSWTEVGTATSWQICLNNDETNLIAANTNPFTVTGLTEETLYTAKVRGCYDGDHYSPWSGITSFIPTAKIVIGSGTTTNSYLPTYIYYLNSLTQQIYTAAELGEAGIITSIDFYCTADNSYARNFDIYMVSTSKDSFESTTDWINVTSADLVYSGSVTLTEGWNTFEIDGFEYDGTSNVAIIVDANATSYQNNIGFYVYNAPSENQAIRIYSDGTDYDPFSPSSYTGTLMSEKNQLRLTKEPLPSCSKPTGLVVTDVTAHTATLSWTSEADAWQICINGDEAAPIDVTTNPYTLTSLDAETNYSVKLRANCGAEDGMSAWTGEVSFTTEIACPAPTALAATDITATSATLNWEGSANAYELEYLVGGASGISTYAFEEDLEGWTNLIANEEQGEWLHSNEQPYGYDYTGLAHGGTGFAMCYSFIDYTGSYDTDAYLVSPTNYQIGEGASLNFWYDMANDSYPEYFEVCVATVAAPTASDFTPIWTLDAKGKNGQKANVRQRNTKSNNWREVTIDLSAYAGQTIWIAFHDVNYDMYEVWIDDITIDTAAADATWIPVGETVNTNQYTITGLDPETTYTVRVRGLYDEGESAWTVTNFTTASLYDNPFELETTDITSNSATLSWTGYQDSYNVRYRKSPALFEDDFDNGMDNWTTIDADGDGYDWILATETGGYYHNAGVDLTGQGHNESTDFVISGSYTNAGGSALTPDNYLISPQITLGGSISFWAQAQDASYPAEHFGVAVSTTGNTDAADFTTIQEWTLAADGTGAKAGTWGKFTVDLSAYAGQQGYVAIRHFNCTDQFLLNIDDVVIYAPEEEWDEWTELTTNVTSTEISNLEPNTKYEWQVQGIYDAETRGTTEWVSGPNFTTLPLITLANDDSQMDADNKNSALIVAAAEAGDKVDVKLAGRTLYKDTKWNTICLPFDVELDNSPLAGATAKTLESATMTDTHVSLTFGDAVTTLEAGKPYIIKWAAADENIVDPVFNDVTIVNTNVHTIIAADGNVFFIGYYDAKEITPDDENIYYMTANNTLKHTAVERTLKACRAYFLFTGEATVGRQLILNFGDGEVTGITDVNMDTNASGWYTVDGKKLDKQPTRKGVYINNGVKVVIK